MRFKTRKGNMIIAPIASKTAASVNPNILKGRSNSQNKGKIKIARIANGQLTAKSKNQSKIAIRVRIDMEVRFTIANANQLPNLYAA